MYTVSQMINDLDSGEEWNKARNKAIASGISREELSKEEKKNLSEAINRRFEKKVSEEQKKNPNVHYEIPHFCSSQKDATS